MSPYPSLPQAAKQKHKMSQYFVKKEDITSGKFIITGSEARHISKSARHRKGDIIRIFDGKGLLCLAEISDISVEQVSGKIIEQKKIPRPETKLTLCFALADKKATENIFDFCTQIGVYAFQPVITERVQGYEPENYAKKSKRTERILISSSKQCERAYIPKLYPPLDFSKAVKKYPPGFIACLEYNLPKLAKAVCLLRSKKDISIFVGPPGDFTAGEISLADKAGLVKISLGDNVLKTEVACMVACSVALNCNVKCYTLGV